MKKIALIAGLGIATLLPLQAMAYPYGGYHGGWHGGYGGGYHHHGGGAFLGGLAVGALAGTVLSRPYGYGGGYGYGYGGYYAPPAPVYVAPAPVYVAPTYTVPPTMTTNCNYDAYGNRTCYTESYP